MPTFSAGCGGSWPSDTFPPVRPESAIPTSPVTTPRWKPSRAFSATRPSASTQLSRRRVT
ncbi:MAG: hypothetical protein QM767_24380 [Anaeromyxobacter sp.]